MESSLFHTICQLTYACTFNGWFLSTRALISISLFPKGACPQIPFSPSRKKSVDDSTHIIENYNYSTTNICVYVLDGNSHCMHRKNRNWIEQSATMDKRWKVWLTILIQTTHLKSLRKLKGALFRLSAFGGNWSRFATRARSIIDT